jgi:hypothetical protein
VTREQRWIRTQEENCVRALTLATKLGAIPSLVRQYRAELSAIRCIAVMIDHDANGLRAPASKRAKQGAR